MQCLEGAARRRRHRPVTVSSGDILRPHYERTRSRAGATGGAARRAGSFATCVAAREARARRACAQHGSRESARAAAALAAPRWAPTCAASLHACSRARAAALRRRFTSVKRASAKILTALGRCTQANWECVFLGASRSRTRTRVASAYASSVHSWRVGPTHATAARAGHGSAKARTKRRGPLQKKENAGAFTTHTAQVI
jgi:hypothetical protein